ncbi:hypothetical protein YC2023_093905 [Brassica napus]
MDALQKKKLLIDRINQGAKSLVFFTRSNVCLFLMLRFPVRLKGPESYLHLSPLNQTLVVIADESHFLKNAQAKMTAASLPRLKAGCKFLVFAHYHSMLEALHQFLKGNDEIKAAAVSIFTIFNVLIPNHYRRK